MCRSLLLVLLFTLGAASSMADSLRVGVSPDYPPLIYKQEGRIVGIEADNARALGEIIGKKLVLVEMPFVELLPALQAGKLDVIMSGMSVTDARRQLVAFTDPYMEMGQMAIIRTDRAGSFAQPWSIYRAGVRVGVEPGTTGAEFAQTKLEDAEIKFFEDPPAAFAGLRSGEIDLYIHDAPTSWRLATTGDNGDLISLYHPLTNETLAWAVRKDDDQLAAMLNDGLRTMKQNGTLRYILNRWIPVTVEVQ